MQRLQILIDNLTKFRKIHISILDLSGILDAEILKIEFKNVIHSKKFCTLAKMTEKGYAECIRCKMLANQKAKKTKKAFFGHCAFGLCEAAVPVVIDGEVCAIVYVGNAIIDEEKTVFRVNKNCRLFGICPTLLLDELKECEPVSDFNELLEIGEIVKDYIKMLVSMKPKEKTEGHWLVSVMKKYAEEMFCEGVLLKEIAITYQKNEKYIGRLFKKETGVTFNEYCMNMRLEKAEEFLLEGNSKIIDIAMSCGFDNISYFNRVFQKKHGMSPRAYRAINSLK